MNTLQLRNEVVLRELDDEILLYDSRNGEAFLINIVGAAIVDFLQVGGLTAQEIEDEIVDATGAERERVHTDVLEFLDSLEERDLLELQT